MPCFSSNTLITTNTGEVRVAYLRPGDMVLSRDHDFRPVRRVVCRTMSGRFLLDNPHLRPVLVCAGSLGNGLPEADMMVSPNCRVPVSGDCSSYLVKNKDNLFAAKQLVNHRGVQQIDTIGITYVYLSFSRHEIISANGVWVECFDTADFSLNAVGNSQRNEVYEIFPDMRRSSELNRAELGKRFEIKKLLRRKL